MGFSKGGREGHVSVIKGKFFKSTSYSSLWAPLSALGPATTGGGASSAAGGASADQVQQSTHDQEEHTTNRQIDQDARPPSSGFRIGDKVAFVWNPSQLDGVAVRWPATVNGSGGRCLRGQVDSGGNYATLQYLGGTQESVSVRGGEISVKLEKVSAGVRTILTFSYGNLSAGDKITCEVPSGYEKTTDGYTLPRQYQLQLDGFSHGGRMLADDDTLRKRHSSDRAPSRLSLPSTGVVYGGGGNCEVTFINGSSQSQLVKAGGTGVFLGPHQQYTTNLTHSGPGKIRARTR